MLFVHTKREFTTFEIPWPKIWKSYKSRVTWTTCTPMNCCHSFRLHHCMTYNMITSCIQLHGGIMNLMIFHHKPTMPTIHVSQCQAPCAHKNGMTVLPSGRKILHQVPILSPLIHCTCRLGCAHISKRNWVIPWDADMDYEKNWRRLMVMFTGELTTSACGRFVGDGATGSHCEWMM